MLGKKVKHRDGGRGETEGWGRRLASVSSFLNMGIVTAPSFLGL